MKVALMEKNTNQKPIEVASDSGIEKSKQKWTQNKKTLYSDNMFSDLFLSPFFFYFFESCYQLFGELGVPS